MPHPPFCELYPASRNQAEKFIYQFFKAQVTGKSIYFCEYTFFLFFWKTRKTREIVSLEVGTLSEQKSSIPKSQDPVEKISNFEPLIILWHLINAITPTSILIFIAAFEFGLQKLIYIDLMQVL